MNDTSNFSINFLDHVAIRVQDLEASAHWYQKVLGLVKFQPEEWKPFPIFLFAGQSGIALFPAKASDPEVNSVSKNVKIDHFAFNVDQANYVKAKQRFTDLAIPFTEENHHYFHSIYLKDPDGHTVELTTLVADVKTFYPTGGA
jgi:catechol 2,3-dioxygenase-like lactoylglutathione lyase family enzyme